MDFNLDNFKNKPPIVVIKDEDINGLSYFKKRLEQLFFSEVIISNSDINGETANLIIEITCNFKLRQGLSNWKAGIWAQLSSISNHDALKNSEFYDLVVELREENSFPIEVVEFSMLFQDCNIIINQLYELSIPEQLDAILTELAGHYEKMTMGMRQVPYEIFIPVFEEDASCCPHSAELVPNVNTERTEASDYFDYWALYFEDQEDALMYGLKARNIIGGELIMLND